MKSRQRRIIYDNDGGDVFAEGADPSQYRHGDNVLSFRAEEPREADKAIVVKSVELRVDYKQREERP